jgi:hypothetical protein
MREIVGGAGEYQLGVGIESDCVSERSIPQLGSALRPKALNSSGVTQMRATQVRQMPPTIDAELTTKTLGFLILVVKWLARMGGL